MSPNGTPTQPWLGTRAPLHTGRPSTRPLLRASRRAPRSIFSEILRRGQRATMNGDRRRRRRDGENVNVRAGIVERMIKAVCASERVVVCMASVVTAASRPCKGVYILLCSMSVFASYKLSPMPFKQNARRRPARHRTESAIRIRISHNPMNFRHERRRQLPSAHRVQASPANEGPHEEQGVESSAGACAGAGGE